MQGLRYTILIALCGALFARAETVWVDANANRHAIDPRVYGVAYGDATTLPDLNVPLNRLGGNNTSRYNWLQNADNRGSDWYFESIGDSSSTAGERGDSFFTMSKTAGAQAMMTIPMVGYVAKLGTNRAKLCSFSIAKYGSQQDADWNWFPDAGNGILSNGQNVSGNNPLDANVAADSTFQKAWVQHFFSTFGGANSGGLKYYILDNEHSIWQGTHRDVHPTGATMDEIKTKMVDYATMIKSVDANAVVVGPEEWGWSGYLYSGYDQQYGAAHNWSSFPDRAAHGNMDYLPWLLDQMRQSSNSAGKRLLDVFTVHYYPQGGEYGSDTSSAMQLRRNRSTRSLWDPNYVDETWIGTQVKLIPRIKGWVSTYYPGTQTGITEYNWGAEDHINGATTQADVYGIFGREGLDLAARWTTPASSTPTYKAMKMYRNYDGNKSTFGDQSCSAAVTNPDNLSAFSAIRTSDGAMTVMVINKATSSSALTINLANFTAGSPAKVWQLTSSNTISNLANVTVTSNSLSTSVPAQSITLFVIPTSGPANQAPTVATSAAASPSPATATTTSLSVLGADDAGEAALVYTWAITGTPPAAVTFSANGTNAAKNSTATFTKAGAYSFQVTIKDAGNLTATSSVNVTVNQTLTSISVTPNPVGVNVNATQQFTASAKDQFSNALSTQPTFTWSINSGGGSVSSSGLYTAPASAGSAQVKAVSGAISGTANITINAVNQAPTVATAASATPSPVTGTTTNLSVLGADDNGEAALVYTWAATGSPPASVSFSANGTNAAKNSTATFTKAGAYWFQVTIKDAGNLTVSSSVNVTVNQTLTSITVTPNPASVAVNATQQFSASAKDQFGNALSSQPTFTWSMNSGGGSVNTSGLYTAPGSAGSASVKATSGAINGTASITITAVNQAPTVATTAAASPSPVTGTTANLSVLGADDNGEAALIYTWATTGNPPAAVTFSANGTNAAKNTTATFTKAGSYSFQVTIKDAGNLTVTSSVNVTVNQMLTTIAVSPPSANVNTGATQQFSASASDQFGATLATQPIFTWSATGGGNIDTAGLFTAGGSGGGPFTISASASGKSGSASVTVVAPPNFSVTITRVATGKTYALGIARPGEHQYIDRSYTISSLSSTLNGAIMIRQANDDKNVSAASNLVFTISTDATVYICYDRRMKTPPAWLSGWTLTNESFVTTDNASSPMFVYSKTFTARSVTLGGNMQSPAGGAKTNYIPIIVPPASASSTTAVAAVSAPTIWSHDGDTDGDGLFDEFEIANGLDPNTPDATNTGNPDETKTASSGESWWDLQAAWLANKNGSSSNGSTTPKTPMTLKHVSGSLNFSTGIDTCSVSGSLPNITGPLSLAGASVHVNIGGADVDFMLAKTGRAKSTEGSIRLSTKPKNGLLPFTVIVKKSMPTLLSDPQASSAAAKTKGALNVTCDVTFSGTVYTATVQSKCSTTATKAAFKY